MSWAAGLSTPGCGCGAPSGDQGGRCMGGACGPAVHHRPCVAMHTPLLRTEGASKILTSTLLRPSYILRPRPKTVRRRRRRQPRSTTRTPCPQVCARVRVACVAVQARYTPRRVLSRVRRTVTWSHRGTPRTLRAGRRAAGAQRLALNELGPVRCPRPAAGQVWRLCHHARLCCSPERVHTPRGGARHLTVEGAVPPIRTGVPLVATLPDQRPPGRHLAASLSCACGARRSTRAPRHGP